ncbi:hypothetical protein I79_010029 [Cricetulus griseus]|uniref:Uncharacterized protein n=1 Tax=Cricetulus griseus TaxID=10029 RepID=G3HHD0_CRIGR|nr:hypothetical protein I79_010029 [Cricetulus griseus]
MAESGLMILTDVGCTCPPIATEVYTDPPRNQGSRLAHETRDHSNGIVKWD